ncbi:hypothetical protein azo3071 [Azoarcus olearius]|uniref:Uncharacterized protein n=1 Tax=Azoarcus sp. (strain BH72) TaxID=418699 RepID=A1KA32_AZOSB|nr:hypothetical protein azo3071 [Azoarcus olearius]
MNSNVERWLSQSRNGSIGSGVAFESRPFPVSRYFPNRFAPNGMGYGVHGAVIRLNRLPLAHFATPLSPLIPPKGLVFPHP